MGYKRKKRKIQNSKDELFTNYSIDEDMWGDEFNQDVFVGMENNRQEKKRCIIGWCFIALQAFATFCYFSTSDLELFSPPYSSYKIIQLIGFHLCLIIGVINLITYRDGIKNSFSSKITAIAITIIVIFSFLISIIL